ncbi:unnamed protein product [Nippostrongylus brasiliensis]|uniref:Succinate dehydrogenase assembly factor 4, mitochondrial n=1 Tax=Nippostrongylus brasiliensis TaxID=27835 RepID=A0A158R3C4_NIPBR|nr:unnamed protein product [Nippostrongylus brasiliensis]
MALRLQVLRRCTSHGSAVAALLPDEMNGSSPAAAAKHIVGNGEKSSFAFSHFGKRTPPLLRETTKRIQRRSKKLAVNVDIDEEPEERFLNVARRSDITMVESEVAVWQPRDIFFDVEHNQPIDFSKEGFIDWNEERASQGSKDSIEKAVDQRSKALEPLPLEEELPPFPPQEAFANMTRDAFM